MLLHRQVSVLNKGDPESLAFFNNPGVKIFIRVKFYPFLIPENHPVFFPGKQKKRKKTYDNQEYRFFERHIINENKVLYGFLPGKYTK